MSDTDTSWIGLHEPHERLQWARRRKFRTGELFAQSIGWDANRYRNHERVPGSSRTTRLTAEKAMFFASRLAVRWEWLFEEDGEPWKAEPDATPRAELLEVFDNADANEQRAITEAVKLLVGRRSAS